MTEGTKIKVHIYNLTQSNKPEIITRRYGHIFTVYENGGKLGIEWVEGEFSPLDSFATCNGAVEFEEVQ